MPLILGSSLAYGAFGSEILGILKTYSDVLDHQLQQRNRMGFCPNKDDS